MAALGSCAGHFGMGDTSQQRAASLYSGRHACLLGCGRHYLPFAVRAFGNLPTFPSTTFPPPYYYTPPSLLLNLSLCSPSGHVLGTFYAMCAVSISTMSPSPILLDWDRHGLW